MISDVTWVPYGLPAAGALRTRIVTVKGGEPLAPVTVIVPSNHVGVSARRLLASGTLGAARSGGTAGLAAVTFLTVYRLAELLGSATLASSGRRPVSTPVIAAGLRAELRADPGVFAPVAQHPATEEALVRTYRELRDLSEEALDAVGARSRRARDIVRLHRATRARLALAWYDEEDLMLAAVEEADAAPALTGDIVVYLPQRLSRHATLLLRAVGARVDLAVIAGATGEARADAEVAASVSGLTEALPLVPTITSQPASPRVVSTSDADEEVRTALRAVIDAARTGTRLDRIAILHPGTDPYPRLVAEQLSAAEVPFNGRHHVPLAERGASRALLGLFTLAESGFRRDDVMAWLASSPILADGHPAPVARWERISREAGVVAGRDDWDLLLARHADDLDARAVDEDRDPDAGQRRAERARSARSLRTFVLRLIDDLEEVASAPRGWDRLAAWARVALQRLLGRQDAWGRWPEGETDAAQRVHRAIDRLGSLAGVEGPVTLDVFTRTLRLELDADLARIGRFGEGVFVGSLSMGVGLDLDLVVVLGLAEGTLPAVLHDDSLLPDREREASGGQLALRSAAVDRQTRWFRAALGGARQHLLVVPRGDLRRSSTRVPSRWLSVLGATPELVASFDAGLRSLAFPATEQEYRLRTLLSTGVLEDATVTRGVTMVRARRSDAFTRFDGNLAGLGVGAPTRTSATSLERWMTCPFEYFMVDVLGVREIDNPEDELRITPLDFGSLFHEILEEFVLERLDAGDCPAPGAPWTQAQLDRALDIAAQRCAVYEAHGLTGRPVYWERDRARLYRDVAWSLIEDNSYRRAQGTAPIAAELAFDDVRLDLGGGLELVLRGKADRVDESTDGSLVVLDYKTGKTDPYKEIRAHPEVVGDKFQLPIYALAARQHVGRAAPVTAAYFFTTGRCDYQQIRLEVTDDLLAQLRDRLGVIARAIGEGVFCHHPEAVSTYRFGATGRPRPKCPYCDPDGLGVVELRRAWDRKREDAVLGAYAEMVEPC